MAIQNLLLITTRYPSAQNPMDGAFVQQFVAALSRQGVKCTVIHPVAWHKYIGRPSKNGPEQGIYNEEIFRPRYISFSFKQIGPFNAKILTQWSYNLSVRRAAQPLQLTPDAIYGHFLFSGAAATQLGKILSKPAFVGIGEGSLVEFSAERLSNIRRDFQTCTGFITVSSHLKKFLVAEAQISAEKVGAFTNGVDTKLFSPRDKKAARAALGISNDVFVAAYVGYFGPNKGIQRVVQALQGLENTGAIYIGDGPIQPDPGTCLFKGRVLHERVPDVLAAADIFILPTSLEGCSNAILEALACGLPVISSNGKFNDDILNDAVSIRVDPMDIEALRAAVCRLRDDPELRVKMSSNALKWVENFDINLRAKRVLAWMNQLQNENV